MNSFPQWFDISYLKEGNNRQKTCYEVLIETRILSILSDFTPVVIGTIPIEIDIPDSDLDIACCASPKEIKEIVRRNFNNFPGFSDRLDNNIYVANFSYKGLAIEIYAEPQPVENQNGFRHMIIEDRILKIAGNIFRHEIVKLKLSGYKTEPAFGKLLNMRNPYTELIDLNLLTDNELKLFINNTYEKNI